MNGPIRIVSPKGPLQGTFHLPGSKSISNRLLIMQSLAGAKNLHIENLSAAQDTQTLRQCLIQEGNEYNCGEGGTSFRFFMALCCTKPGIKTLDASVNFYGRPVSMLVDALRQCGVNIRYTEKEGFPPVVIEGMADMSQPMQVSIPGNISSQFISALMMIAPYFNGGGTIQCTTPLVSMPYIEMTRSLMVQAGVNCTVTDRTILISEGEYSGTFHVEADWSAASYAYSLCAIRPGSEIFLPSLAIDSLQGDRESAAIGKKFGVQTQVHSEGISIISSNNPSKGFQFMFEHCPDLAQTFILSAFGLGMQLDARGLVTLRRKETDRLWALANVISMLGGNATFGKDFLLASGQPLEQQVILPVYNDHRMAMSLAPLSLVTSSIELDSAEVVAKSFPAFWDQLQELGFTVSPTESHSA